MSLGYLYYTRQPPEYMASATVQVVSPIPASARVQPYNAEDVMQVSRQDESLVIASELVLNMAAEKLAKNDHPMLKGMDNRQIAGFIAGGRRLTVSPGTKDANTTLININFVCEDQRLSAMVVNAIVEGYSDYISEEYRTVGEEIYKLMTEAQEKVAKSFAELREKTQKAREEIDMPIVWTSEGPVNPYTTNLQSLNARLSDLEMDRTLLQSKLTHATAALKSERDPEAILLWLADSEHIELPVTKQESSLDRTLAKQHLESERLERQDLFKLKMEEQRYLNSVGESHPALASVRQQISLLQKQIARIREAERAEEAEMLKELADRQDKDAADPIFKPVTAAERLATRLRSMQEALAGLQLEEQGLRDLMHTNEEASKKLSKAIQDVEMTERELALVETMQSAYLEKLKQLELGPNASQQRTLKELSLPSNGYFYGPKLPPYLLGGGAIGFMVLAGLAVLLDLADKSFRNPEDIAAEVGAPVLGHIPAMELDKVIKKPNQTVDGSLVTIHHSRGRVSEAYRGIRTGLFFSNRTGDLKVIQVTSPVPGDGKSTLSANLAITMAQSGRNVLLIDADFRRPRIAKLFSIDSDRGMATVVAGACELDDAIHQSTVPFLSVMPGGKRPSNPAELLSSQRFSDLLGVLREKFDIIIIDTPPLLAVSDPGAVAAVVDGVVLTMRLRRNVKPLVNRAAKILESVDANVLGIVVNGVSQDAGYGYNYGYRDYRYAYQTRYGYGYKNYGYNSSDGYGAKRYLEEPHDVNTDHALVQDRDS